MSNRYFQREKKTLGLQKNKSSLTQGTQVKHRYNLNKRNNTHKTEAKILNIPFIIWKTELMDLLMLYHFTLKK